jgi:hypothetical protein
VRAPRPTTRPAHAAAHLIDAYFDAAFSGGFLFGRRDPTNPLVTRQRGEVGPKPLSNGIKLNRLSEISWELMNRAVRELLSVHTPSVFVPPNVDYTVLNSIGEYQTFATAICWKIVPVVLGAIIMPCTV